MHAHSGDKHGAEAVGFPAGVAYIDGDYCPVSQARISVLDWGLLRSDATYDVVHVWKRRFFRLDKHLDRFLRSVARLQLELPFDRDGLTTVLRECVRRSALDNAYVEMICTRGVSPTFSRDPRDAVNRFIAFAIPFGWVADARQRERGLRLAVATTQRIPPESVDPTVKNYHWLDFVGGLFEAYDRGAENVVMLNARGEITEGPGFNIFLVEGGRLLTPHAGVLEGITRATVLELAAELDLPAQQCALAASRLLDADEVFITSTAGGVMPVAAVDGRPVGTHCPGPLTQRLTRLYWQKHDDARWTTPVD